MVVLVRPEAIQVDPVRSDRPDCNSIEGRVETITFHGAVTRLGVNVYGQRIVADVNAATTEPISLNKSVWLTFPPEACQVMAQTNPPSED